MPFSDGAAIVGCDMFFKRMAIAPLGENVLGVSRLKRFR